jgi:hypothetical protein
MVVARDEDIVRFEVAMGNAVIGERWQVRERSVARIQPLCAWQRAAIAPRPQSFAVKQFRDNVGAIAPVANIEGRQNARMIERGCSSRFLLETP